MKFTAQTEAAECGLACLVMVAGHYGYDADLPSVRRRFGLSLKGATLTQLIKIAGQMQLASRPLKLGMDDFYKLKRPCLLHWDFNHFVVLVAVGRNTATIYDPAVGKRVLPLTEVSKHFTGIALELTPTPGFVKKTERVILPLSQLWHGVQGLGRNYVQIFALALILQLFALLAPLFLQLVVDQVLPAAESSLLTTLGIGFILLLLIQTATEALRSWVVLRVGIALNFQMLSNLFHHLLRLPMHFFERRHLGDLVSRFGSLENIQRSLTNSFIEALVDGVMVVFSLALMVLYSPALAGISIAALLMYALGRWLWFIPLKEASYNELAARAKQDSHFLESVRGVQALKLFNRVPEREGVWQNLFISRLNAQQVLARMGIGFAAFSHIILGGLHLIVIWLGAKQVMTGNFSLGMLYAFISYKSQFTDKASAFIEKIIEFKMLNLHAERVADIALELPEFWADSPSKQQEAITLLQVQNLSYRYSALEAPVFESVNFEAISGQCLVLTGPSGCGKTTLLKVLLGLLPASHGQVLINGQPLQALGSGWRDNIGVVMQDDTLFAGSIADNIAFSDADSDMQKIMAAAHLAAVHEDIVKLPMAYNTLVGDMGSSLSGGQKQRVLLARALYRQPSILFLDEASSHLDIESERRINDSLKNLNIMRIVIAHRPETIATGDVVVYLTNGS